MQPQDTILIVDFGSQVTQLIARRVREAGVYCEIAPFNASGEAFERLRPKGIIFSGGPSSVMWEDSPRAPQHFFDQGLPILAICRGIQVLNVAYGGTLVQDIPSQISSALEHRMEVPPHHSFDYAHEIWIENESTLARLMSDRLKDSDTCEVNSRHHQAVKELAPGFQVSATAPDGIIEAIEHPAAPFCLGVQWHPENFWRTGEFRALFEGFLEASQTKLGS